MMQNRSIQPVTAPRIPGSLGWNGVIGIMLVALLVALLVGGCGETNEPVSPDVEASSSPVVATVGEAVITELNMVQEVARLKSIGRPVPEKGALLKQMIEHTALLQQALGSGIESDPTVRRTVDDLLIAQWRDRNLKQQIEGEAIDEAALRQAYEKRKDDYITPAKVRLALLKLNAPKKMSPARQDQLEARMAEARKRSLASPPTGGRGPSGVGFGSLSIEFSDDATSRYRGGDIGWLDAGSFRYRWPQRVLATGYGLKKGIPSEILREKDGYYLVMKTDERPGATHSFESVQTALRLRLRAERQNRLRLELHLTAMSAHPCKIDQKNLARVKLPEPEITPSQRSMAGTPTWPKGGTTRK